MFRNSTVYVLRQSRRTLAFQQYEKSALLLKRKISLGAYSLLIIPAATFGLGVWQVFRWRWKLALIDTIKEKMNQQPIPLPEDLRDLKPIEYTPVKLVGEFDYSREFVIAPRQRLDEHFATAVKGAAFFDLGVPVGGLVVTPFKPKGRDYSVLVARGWVPQEKFRKETRLESEVHGEVEIIGITRNSEKKPSFVPRSQPLKNYYPFRDVETMARYHNTAPVYFELIYDHTVPNGPIAGQTRVSIPNNHVIYFLTWFGVSGSTLLLWFQRFVKARF